MKMKMYNFKSNMIIKLLSFCNIVMLLLNYVETLAPAYYGIERATMEYELPPLEFGFSELEPYIDEETVRIHYLGHHAKYTEKMNLAFKEWRVKDRKASRIPIIDVLRNLSIVPLKWRKTLQNNCGGFANHNFYWSVLSPNQQRQERVPVGQLSEEINEKWGNFATFKRIFTEEANNLFGSGYVWLCRNYTEDKQTTDLVIVKTANQDSPLEQKLFPLLVIDVWEHAYYLNYHNLRPKYVENWWMIVDWEAVSKLGDWWKRAIFHDEL